MVSMGLGGGGGTPPPSPTIKLLTVLCVRNVPRAFVSISVLLGPPMVIVQYPQTALSLIFGDTHEA